MAVKGKSSGKGTVSKGAPRRGASAPRARSGKARGPAALEAAIRPSAEKATARHLNDDERSGRVAESGLEKKAARAKLKTEAKPEALAEGALSRLAAFLRRGALSRRSRLVAALVALAVVVAAVVAYGAWLLWRPDVEGSLAERPGPAAGQGPTELATRMEALEEAVTGLKGEIAAAEERIAANVARAVVESGAAKSAAGRSAAAIDELSGRVFALEKSGPSEPGAGAAGKEALAQVQAETQRLANAVAELAGRLTALEQSLRAAKRSPAGLPWAFRRQARMLALMALRDALGSARPFAVELVALEQAFEGDEAVAALAPLAEWAGRGVPTLETLQRRFEDLAPRLLRAAKTPADGGWLAETWSRITSVIVIRRIGDDAPGDAPGAILARAEAKMARGDLAGAVAEIMTLKGRAAAAAGEWMRAARGRLAADAALKALTARATALAGGTQGGGTGAAKPGDGPGSSAFAPRQPDATER